MIFAARRAFTLVELLVASAIMVVLVLVVVKVANDTLSAYDRVVADLSAQTEARAVLDNLERDLNSAVIRPDGRCWMEIIAPSTAGAPAGFSVKVPNIPADLQPVLLFFASPPDRPRFQPGMATRDSNTGARLNEIRGEVCAIAYRIGLRSPFDSPGELVQQVYTVQRTVLDAQSTFTGALTGAVAISGAPNLIPPSTFWNGSREVADYTNGVRISKQLFDGTYSGGWTMDEANFCAQNVVAMSLTLWCSSSESRVQDDTSAAAQNRAAFINGLPPEALRPVMMYSAGANSDPTLRSGIAASSGSGQLAAYAGFLPSAHYPAPTLADTVRKDRFLSRARVFSDRILVDNRTVPLPYTLRQVEVSVTVLTPQGSRELRGLQAIKGNVDFGSESAATSLLNFRRIVIQHGRPFSRGIQVLGTGG